MPHVNKQEREQRTASQAGFAAIGRAIADHAARGESATHLYRDAAARRLSELTVTDSSVHFAALARQVGDAVLQERDTSQLVDQLRELRRRELGGTPHIRARDEPVYKKP